MNDRPDEQDEHKSMGKGMLFFAWIAAFGLLIAVFNKQLAEQINPNANPESMRNGQQVEIRLQQNRYGHYVVSGQINDQPVTFLLDTGATRVSVPAHLSEQLNLTPGRASRVRTANGIVTVRQTRIERLAIGDIVLTDVEANLNPGMGDDEILLGMSALKQLEFTQRQDWLILRSL